MTTPTLPELRAEELAETFGELVKDLQQYERADRDRLVRTLAVFFEGDIIEEDKIGALLGEVVMGSHKFEREDFHRLVRALAVFFDVEESSP